MVQLLPLLLLLLIHPVFSQINFNGDEDSKREKYGLSQAEWRIYKESGMSENNLENLISCGITMNEYNSRPWVTVGVSEKDWLIDRCKGLNDQDMQAFNDKGESDHGIIFSFLLPGSYHWYNRSFVKASIFSGVFIGAITLYFALPAETSSPVAVQNGGPYGKTVIEKKPRNIFLIVGVADMVASAVFAYRDIHKDKLEDKAEKWSIEPTYASSTPGLKYIRSF